MEVMKMAARIELIKGHDLSPPLGQVEMAFAARNGGWVWCWAAILPLLSVRIVAAAATDVAIFGGPYIRKCDTELITIVHSGISSLQLGSLLW